MIRKTKLGKRMLAMLMCGMLTFTSVVPAMASEVSESATTQTEVTENQDNVLSETPAAPESEVTEVENETLGGANQRLKML